MTGLKDEENATRRPLGQRVTAAVLAVAMLVSGCGGAFNEAESLESTSSVDPGAARLELSQLKWTTSEFTMEDEASNAPDAVEEIAGSSAAPMEKAVGSECVISKRIHVSNLSAAHKRNLVTHWTEKDPARPGQLRPRTIDSRHTDMKHAEAHHHAYHRKHFHPGGHAVHYTAKFNEINHQTNSANWTTSIRLPLDPVNCGRHIRKLNQVEADPSAPAEKEGFPWVGTVTAIVVGTVFSFAGSALVAVYATEAVAPWAAAITGCVVGFIAGGAAAYMDGNPGHHEVYLAGSLINCVFSFVGSWGAAFGKAERLEAKAAAARAAAAALDGVEAAIPVQSYTSGLPDPTGLTGIPAYATAVAARAAGPDALGLHLRTHASIAATRLREAAAGGGLP